MDVPSSKFQVSMWYNEARTKDYRSKEAIAVAMHLNRFGK